MSLFSYPCCFSVVVDALVSVATFVVDCVAASTALPICEGEDVED